MRSSVYSSARNSISSPALGKDEVGWRFRQFVKATLPLWEGAPIFLSAYDEIFVDLNEPDWGQRTGFSQNRFFLGLGWKFDSPAREWPLSLEVGYLNQFLNGRSRPDKINHILSMNLFLSF